MSRTTITVSFERLIEGREGWRRFYLHASSWEIYLLLSWLSECHSGRHCLQKYHYFYSALLRDDYYPFDLQYWGYHAIEIENQKKNILSVIIHNKIILFSNKHSWFTNVKIFNFHMLKINRVLCSQLLIKPTAWKRLPFCWYNVNKFIF